MTGSYEVATIMERAACSSPGGATSLPDRSKKTLFHTTSRQVVEKAFSDHREIS